MTATTAILITLVIYKLLLLGIGIAANRVTHDETDFFLGGRGLGPWVAALSASASSSSAWTLLGVSGFAYANGLQALWLLPGCIGGFALNWYVLAPALRRHSEATHALTVTDVLAGPSGTPLRRTIVQIASGITLVCLLTYVASQFQGAGKTFADTFDMAYATAVALGTAIIVAYTMLGGFWAVSLTDSLQGLVMAAAALILPIVALSAVGGPSDLVQSVATIDVPGYTSLLGNVPTTTALGTVVGLLGIGLGYPGQPHVVNRFMAMRDDQSVIVGRRVAIAWAVIIYVGMITVGLAARVLTPELADRESAFIGLTTELLPPVFAGIMVAAALSAIMSTADSQLLVAASTITHDLRRDDAPTSTPAQAMWRSRVVVLVLSLAAMALALVLDASIFANVLSAWAAMGSAFGPALLCIVFGRRPSSPRLIAAMLVGFCGSTLAHVTVTTARGMWEGVVPFVIALAIVAWPRRR